MSFKDLALSLAARGIPVIPVQPLSKETYLPGGEERGSTDPQQIAGWDAENPDYNVGCLGTPNGVTILDCDVPGLMTRIEQETGQKFPATFTVKSGGKQCAHLYFRQTDASRRLGNKKGDGLFDLRGSNHYVVGPGSKLKVKNTSLSSGNSDKSDAYITTEYKIWRDAPIADFPDWLEPWILQNSSSRKGAETGEVDTDSYIKLRNRYKENLNPEDMFGLDGLDNRKAYTPLCTAWLASSTTAGGRKTRLATSSSGWRTNMVTAVPGDGMRSTALSGMPLRRPPASSPLMRAILR